MNNNSALKEIAVDLAGAATQLTVAGLMRGWSGQMSARSVIGEESSIVLKRSGGNPEDPAAYCRVDMKGGVLEPVGAKSSIVTRIHCAIYASRPDVHAVIQCRGLYADAVASVIGKMPLSLETYWALKAEPVVIDQDALRSDTFDQYVDKMVAEVSGALAKSDEGTTVVCIPFYGMWVVGASVAEVVTRAIAIEELAKSAYLRISLAANLREPAPDFPIWFDNLLLNLSRPRT